jgi:dTDP-4-dehydrorhamnose 3,5-epimerase
VGEFYAPGHEGGLRYDDPALELNWPLPVSEISEKDCAWPLLSEAEPAVRARMSESEPASAARSAVA